MAYFASRSSIVSGLLSVTLLSLALFGGSYWLHCEEKTALFNSAWTNVAFDVGIWRICPVNGTNNNNNNNNNTHNYVFKKTAECVPIPYKTIQLDNFHPLEVWGNLQFTSQFVSRMRVSVPFGCIGLVFLTVATMFAVIGHWKENSAMLLACGLYILSCILIGSGLLLFASVLADSYYEGTLGDNNTLVVYYYGWAFFYAVGALAMTKVAVVFSLTSYIYKFATVEEMVRAMVPGADRHLRNFSNEILVQAPEVVPPPAPYRDADRQTPDICETDRHQQQQQLLQSTLATKSCNNNNPRTNQNNRFKTLSGREPRYAAPPRPPAQFYSLPRRSPAEQLQLQQKQQQQQQQQQMQTINSTNKSAV